MLAGYITDLRWRKKKGAKKVICFENTYFLCKKMCSTESHPYNISCMGSVAMDIVIVGILLTVARTLLGCYFSVKCLLC